MLWKCNKFGISLGLSQECHKFSPSEWECCSRFVNASGFWSVCFNGNWLPPLFRCLSHWVMKWRRGQPLGQFLLSPLPHRTLCHSPPFDRHWLRQIFVQISLSCGLPLLHKLLKIYCACRALAGSLSPSLSLSVFHLFCVYSVYIYLSISKCTAYIQIVCYWKLFDELTSAL